MDETLDLPTVLEFPPSSLSAVYIPPPFTFFDVERLLLFPLVVIQMSFSVAFFLLQDF